MPLSPHTPPGTHIVCTWETASLEEYAYHVVKPEYRQRFIAICLTHGYKVPTFTIGEKYVLLGIEETISTKSGFLCTVVGGHNCGHALEHFDVAQLPKAITDLLLTKPVDREADVHDAINSILHSH